MTIVRTVRRTSGEALYREEAVLVIHKQLVEHQDAGSAHGSGQDGVGNCHGDDLSVT